MNAIKFSAIKKYRSGGWVVDSLMLQTKTLKVAVATEIPIGMLITLDLQWTLTNP